jgi:hypothetical protein
VHLAAKFPKSGNRSNKTRGGNNSVGATKKQHFMLISNPLKKLPTAMAKNVIHKKVM